MSFLRRLLIALILFLLLAAALQKFLSKKELQAYLEKGTSFRFEGRKLHYRLEGAGPLTVVLLHGQEDNLTAWDLIAKELSKEVEVLRLDRAGFGGSAFSGNTSLKAAAKDLHASLQDAKIEKPIILLGYDWGGALALQYADTYPSDLSALFLINALSPKLQEENFPKQSFLQSLSRASSIFALSRLFSKKNDLSLQTKVQYSLLKEFLNLDEMLVELRQVKPKIWYKPLTVIMSEEHPFRFKEEGAWRQSQEFLLEYSRKPKFIFAKGASYDLLSERAELISASVLDLAKELSSQR